MMAASAVDYDVIVIGAGTGGLVAADFAVALGAKTALIERERIGGDCTWHGCVPSKTLIRIARMAHEARTGLETGILTAAAPPQVEMRRVRERIQAAIQQVYQYETPAVLADKGIDFIAGGAEFIDPHTVILDGARPLRASHFILATGARPQAPTLSGLDAIPYLTYRTIFDLEVLPRELVIVGDGPVACEMAQAYQRLGSQVTLVGERLLPRDEPEAAAAVEAVFAREGIRRIAACAVLVTGAAGNFTLTAEDGQSAQGTHLLIAAGRVPNGAGIGLERAGVALDDGAIRVDRHLRTSAAHIYAVGDCTGGYQFTHYAGWQGFVAVRNALLPLADEGINDSVPWVTFVDPEVAHAGMTEAQARTRYANAARVSLVRADHIDRAVADGDDQAFVKVVYHQDGRLLGATLCGKGAGESIAEYCLAIHHKMKLGELARAFHPYPTYATTTQLIASEFAREQTLGGLTGQLLRASMRLPL